MANYKTGAQRYNDRMDKIFANAHRLEKERLARGEMPNPSLTSPEEAAKHGWTIKGRDVKRAVAKKMVDFTSNWDESKRTGKPWKKKGFALPPGFVQKRKTTKTDQARKDSIKAWDKAHPVKTLKKTLQQSIIDRIK